MKPTDMNRRVLLSTLAVLQLCPESKVARGY
jgi:hypothetical protein